jgi:hypothetical protein
MMLKGCKKNVVYVKNTGSEMFESAYFIVADGIRAANRSESDMLAEANRIIKASPVGSYFSREGESAAESKKGCNRAAWFMLGAVIMASLNALIYLII